ncbi:MAG: hypothetical protein NTU94_04335 [Planctomycetota bacterium]|nr:hypothetical protein [Planctomycetota bacterium]
MSHKARSFAHLFLASVSLLAAVCMGCGQAETKAPGGAAAKAGPADGVAPERFQAAIYEVHLPPAMVGQLDAQALAAKGPTAADLEKVLAAIGRTRAVYQVDQSVNPAKDMINVGARVPTITSSHTTEAGATTNSISYQSVGAIFKFAGRPAEAGRKVLDLKLAVEISAILESGPEMSKGVKATTIGNCSMGYTGPVELGRPFVFFSVDATVKDADSNAIAYVCRAVMGEPKP